MKRFLTSLLIACMASVSAFAMSYEMARREALYLTDKMAYELNLNQAQMDYAYEINLDYFMGMNHPSDVLGIRYTQRYADLRCILHDWQYTLFLAADYFLHPIVWHNSAWHFPVYTHYVHNHFYYSHPRVYVSYRGGHSRLHHHNGYYTSLRPKWTKGLRDSHRTRAKAPKHNNHNMQPKAQPHSNHNARPKAKVQPQPNKGRSSSFSHSSTRTTVNRAQTPSRQSNATRVSTPSRGSRGGQGTAGATRTNNTHSSSRGGRGGR